MTAGGPDVSPSDRAWSAIPRAGPLQLSLLVGILGVLPFLSSLPGGEFLNWDDPYLVAKNKAIHTWTVGQIFNPLNDREPLGAEFLPVRDLTYVIDAQLFPSRALRRGPRGGPSAEREFLPQAAFGLRAMNLLYYGLACGLATGFLIHLLGPDRRHLALIAALLFAWHPAHAESAAWISGRKDVVSGALVFAALLLHLRARRHDHWSGYLGVACLAVLACLAKSTATALPFLVGAVEVFDPPGGRGARGWRRAARILPTLMACGLVALVAIQVGRQTGIARPARDLGRVLLEDLPILRRYLVTSTVPLVLRIDHGDLIQALARAPWRHALLSLLAIAPLVALAFRRYRPLLGLCGLWFLGGLVPVLQLVPFTQPLADRFLFLPALAAALLLARVGVGLGRRNPRWGRTLIVALLLGFFVRAGLRAWDFSTSERLWRSQLRVAGPDDPLALSKLADAQFRRAHALARQRRRPEALALLGQAATLLESALPGYEALPRPLPGHAFEAQALLGECRRFLGDREGAQTAWRLALNTLDRYPELDTPLRRMAMEDRLKGQYGR